MDGWQGGKVTEGEKKCIFVSKKRMPKRDFFHREIRAALEADGWTITDDPMQLI